MKHLVFSVYDTKAQSYLPPIYFNSTGVALRVFTDTVNDKSTVISKHPEDYCLFHIGSFDDASCTFDLKPAPVALAQANELLIED
ncbi:nonstructural protein [Microviridae sp.]|nr:nonstructural protein [Microviridae sp.]